MYLLEAVLDAGNSKYGFMDRNGRITIPLIYDCAKAFAEGRAYVESNREKFYIDPDGTEVLDVSAYQTGESFEFGLAMVTRVFMQEIEGSVKVDLLQGLIDKSGNEILPCEYEAAGIFENGIIWAKKDGKCALFDGAGNLITEHEYDDLTYAGEDLIIAEKDGLKGFLDRNGNVAIPFEFLHVGSFAEGWSIVSDEEWQITYINARGERLTEFGFEEARDFSDGRAAVKQGGMYGFIDTGGEPVIPFIYDEVESFKGGIAVGIEQLGRNTVCATPIDVYGNPAVIPDSQGMFRWNDITIMYYDPEKFEESDPDYMYLALLDEEGNRLTGFYYTDISEFCEGVAVIQELGEDYTFYYGLINRQGAEIIPSTYSKLEIVDAQTVVVQSSEIFSRIGIATLPKDAATRPHELEEWR